MPAAIDTAGSSTHAAISRRALREHHPVEGHAEQPSAIPATSALRARHHRSTPSPLVPLDFPAATNPTATTAPAAPAPAAATVPTIDPATPESFSPPVPVRRNHAASGRRVDAPMVPDLALTEAADAHAVDLVIPDLPLDEDPHYLPPPIMPAPARALASATETPPIFHPRWTPTTSVRPIVPSRGQAPAVSISVRRAARGGDLMAGAAAPVRHARQRRAARIRAVFVIAAAGALVFGGAAAVTAAVTGSPVSDSAGALALLAPVPQVAASIAPPPVPPPAPSAVAELAAISPCDTPEVTAALTAGDDAATIAAMGGATEFRQAVASGMAPCVSLADPARVWVVINKVRPFVPLDYAPASVAMPEGVRSLSGGALRSDAAASLAAMAAAAATAGVGEIALESGYRSYTTQVTSYGNQVAARGTDGADLVSARPGYSEHQSGLAADVVACAGGCGTLDDLAATAQGQWVLAHAFEYGWIVRYEDGGTPVTGYLPEPWHLRYIGPDLAREYHDGGWHTFEEFFGLEPASGYIG
ncbi:hypothetical protein ASD65_11970 [Microbacterium sp. Root61]|uniref:M15 family metallopeptidase n=1 Tax=Microbacterium sp. Root61 TaxID=1736570 RepID=UPI0006F59516|nr:M15 family metallopeptidase [Microbacterium sp. Root61]KRA25060.1 hypothetical protein ASD65_11970 [Microbacterium sp. Root61]